MTIDRETVLLITEARLRADFRNGGCWVKSSSFREEAIRDEELEGSATLGMIQWLQDHGINITKGTG